MIFVTELELGSTRLEAVGRLAAIPVIPLLPQLLLGARRGGSPRAATRVNDRRAGVKAISHRPAASWAKAVLRLERPERQHVDDACQRLERLAAVIMVESGQPAMAMRIMLEPQPDAVLFCGDRPLATHAPRAVRTAAAACRNQNISQEFPQFRIAPCKPWHDSSVTPRARRGGGLVAWQVSTKTWQVSTRTVDNAASRLVVPAPPQLADVGKPTSRAAVAHPRTPHHQP
jgi:hypothetical protein